MKKTVDICLTPEELAYEFAVMASDDQAKFFNALADEVKNWRCSFEQQVIFIRAEEGLNVAGRAIMDDIGFKFGKSYLT